MKELVFQKSKIKISKEKIIFSLPKNILDHINLNNKKEIYWAINNGTIQINGEEPNFLIPAIKIIPENFLEH